MLYYRLNCNVLPWKMDEFLKAFEKELLPMEEKRGIKLAGCYRWFGACGRRSLSRPYGKSCVNPSSTMTLGSF